MSKSHCEFLIVQVTADYLVNIQLVVTDWNVLLLFGELSHHASFIVRFGSKNVDRLLSVHGPKKNVGQSAFNWSSQKDLFHFRLQNFGLLK